MVNKKFCLGMLLMVLVFGMTVVGCNDDVQIVAFEYAEGPSKVNVQIGKEDKLVSGNIVTVDVISLQWDSCRNAVSYNVYGQLKGSVDIQYSRTTDIFIMDIPLEELRTRGEWRFGVTATDIDKNHVPSKIVWSEYITIQ